MKENFEVMRLGCDLTCRGYAKLAEQNEWLLRELRRVKAIRRQERDRTEALRRQGEIYRHNMEALAVSCEEAQKAYAALYRQHDYLSGKFEILYKFVGLLGTDPDKLIKDAEKQGKAPGN